jgi:hypothetical protein
MIANLDRGGETMGFLDTLKRAFSRDSHAPETDEIKKSIRQAWGLEEDEGPPQSGSFTLSPSSQPTAETASDYDRSHWTKKLRHLLETLPDSQKNWPELMAEAHALNFEPAWISGQQRDGFAFLIRRAVSDRVVSEAEHHKLDLARTLIGLSEAESEQTLHAIKAEAEAFFDAPVQDDM